MKRGSLLLLTVAVALAAVVGAVSRSDAASGSRSATAAQLTIASFPISSLDLYRTNAASTVSGLTLETLLRVDPQTGKVVPWLAQKVSHPNPYVWVYTLRKGVKFWNGNEMTAEDAANS